MEPWGLFYDPAVTPDKVDLEVVCRKLQANGTLEEKVKHLIFSGLKNVKKLNQVNSS